MKRAGSIWPRAMSARPFSHRPVVSGEASGSGTTEMSSLPFSVGRSDFFARCTYPTSIRRSRIAARVAGVPEAPVLELAAELLVLDKAARVLHGRKQRVFRVGLGRLRALGEHVCALCARLLALGEGGKGLLFLRGAGL